MPADAPSHLVVPGFELVRELGRGAMGVVFLATDRELKRSVAIKFLHAAGPNEAERRRFAREARLFGKLSHPNLVRVYDADPLAQTPYLVMELIEGRDLGRALLTGEGPDVLELGRALASALAYIHAQGILHRDLKPANVLLAGSRPLLTDFGLAREVSLDATAITVAGAVLGTPAYMSPEVVDGAPHSPASDVYSLALILYETAAATSKVPPSDDALVRLRQRLSGQIRTLASLGVEAPAGLDPLLTAALAMDPAQRPDAPRFFAELEQLGRPPARRRSGGLRASGGSGGAAVVGAKAEPARVDSRPGASSRRLPVWQRRGARGILALAAGVGLAVGGLLVWSRAVPRTPPAPRTTGSPSPAPLTLNADLVAAHAARSRQETDRIWREERAREPMVYRTRTEVVFEPGAGVKPHLGALMRAERQSLLAMEELQAQWDRLVPESASLPLDALGARAHVRAVTFLIWTSVQRVDHVHRMASGTVKPVAIPIPGVSDGIEQLRRMSFPLSGAAMLERYFTDARELLERLAAPGESSPELIGLVNDLWWVCQTFRAMWATPGWIAPYCLAFDRMRAGVGRIRGPLRRPLERVLDDFWFVAWNGCGTRKAPTLKVVEADLSELARVVPQRVALERLAGELIARMRDGREGR